MLILDKKTSDLEAFASKVFNYTNPVHKMYEQGRILTSGKAGGIEQEDISLDRFLCLLCRAGADCVAGGVDKGPKEGEVTA